jgi:hypothetical protein
METSSVHWTRASASCALAFFGLVGCNDPNTKDPDPPCVPVADEVCSEETGEAGDPPEPRELEPGECRFNDSNSDPSPAGATSARGSSTPA